MRVLIASLARLLLPALALAAPAGFPNDHLQDFDGTPATKKVREVSEASRLQRALWRIGRGKTLYIRGGRYELDRTLLVERKRDVRIAGYPGERVVLDWSRAAEGNPGLKGIIVRFSRDVTFENLELVGTSDEALSNHDTRGLTVRFCRIHHCGTRSQNAWSIAGTDVLGEHNLFYGTSSHVIYIKASNVILRNNVILM